MSEEKVSARSGSGYGDAELVLQALALAQLQSRRFYVIKGVIQADRPPIGPFITCYPNGSTTSEGLGRKRQRRKKVVPAEGVEPTSD